VAGPLRPVSSIIFRKIEVRDTQVFGQGLTDIICIEDFTVLNRTHRAKKPGAFGVFGK
jgi:hypothetical protein